MSTYYLSGPMTGLPDLNYPAFRDAATVLRGRGHTVYNPADWETDGGTMEPNHSRVFNLKRAFADYCAFIIYRADAVVALDGWENSPGANAEVALARALGKPVLLYPTLKALPAWTRPPECSNHVERQRRDGLPKHCHTCGWRHARPTSPARKIGKSRAERDEMRRLGREQGDVDRTSEVP